jgi:hypothetical protein
LETLCQDKKSNASVKDNPSLLVDQLTTKLKVSDSVALKDKIVSAKVEYFSEKSMKSKPAPVDLDPIPEGGRAHAR